MNNGFSAPTRYWTGIPGLTPKSSSDGKTSQLAEAPDEYGDTVQADVYGEVIAPTTEYVVTGEIHNATSDTNLVTLGNVIDYTVGTVTKKIMPTQVVINTQAGQPPTVTISGVEVEATAYAKRVYPIKVDLLPKSKAQDVVGALATSSKYTSITTTFSVDPHVQTVGGVPVASDCGHGRVEVQATMTDGDNTGVIEVATGSGFVISAAASENRPDAGYVTRTATLWKALTGQNRNPPSQSLQSTPPPSGDGTRGEADGETGGTNGETGGDDNSR